MAEDRKKLLAERFSKREKSEDEQTQAKKKRSSANRRRHSLYLDNTIVTEIDKQYKKMAHELYPVEIDKADFMEALLVHGLKNLDQIKARLNAQPEKQ